MLPLEMMKMKNRIARGLTLMLLALGLASPALASDGVLGINQTCAQAGCFNGDSPGWPVTIIRSGSYRLTSNLNVPDENTNAIVVSANDVGIDLNNFAIIGSVTCSGEPLSCTPASGSGHGISVDNYLTRSHVTVKDGSITGMGSDGVRLCSQANVTSVKASHNNGSGINVRTGSTVSGNMVTNNGHGIEMQSAGLISGNTIFANAGYGVHAVTACTNPPDCTAYGRPVCSLNLINSNALGTILGLCIELSPNICNLDTTCP